MATRIKQVMHGTVFLSETTNTEQSFQHNEAFQLTGNFTGTQTKGQLPKNEEKGFDNVENGFSRNESADKLTLGLKN